jgi:hypothetical protein
VEKEVSREQLIDLFDRAANAQSMCKIMIDMDSTGNRIPVEDRSRLISMALAAGGDWAAELRNQYPVGDIEFVARELGIRVEVSDQPAQPGAILVRAEYYAQPPRIVLFRHSIRTLQDLMESSGVTGLLPPELIIPIHVAHEIFHYIEDLKKDSLSKRYLVTTFRLGPLRLRSKVRVLTEMGAHAFAQQWLGLNWFPSVIDLIDRLISDNPISPVEKWDEFMRKRGLGILPRWFSDKGPSGKERRNQ